MTNKGKGFIDWVCKHKFITISMLFTFFTMLDTIPILLGWYPAKEGLDTYIHLLGRFVLHTIIVFGIFSYKKINEKIKNSIFSWLLVYVVTQLMLFGYLMINGLFTELHPDAYYYAFRSYASVFFLVVIFSFLLSKLKFRKNKSIEKA